MRHRGSVGLRSPQNIKTGQRRVFSTDFQLELRCRIEIAPANDLEFDDNK